MKTLFYPGCELVLDEGVIKDPLISMDKGIFKEIGSASPSGVTGAEVISYPLGTKIVPGFIDLHIHGTNRADVMDAKEDTIPTMVRHLPGEGTTAFLATTLTQSKEKKIQALQNAASYMSMPTTLGAELLGIHLEGPFISLKRAGAQPKEFIHKPDVSLFKEFQEASGGAIKLATIAPEEGMGFVRFLAQNNVIPSIGHSDATYVEVREAAEQGAVHATHLFNGMRGIHHRDIGTAGGIFLHDSIKAELIADGIHVSPEMIRLTYKNKGADGIILITDAMRAKGLPDGQYDLGGQAVTVRGKKAELCDGTLAGSVLKMNEAVRNMVTFSGCSFNEAITMASLNPARQLGVDDRKGSIQRGKDADFAVLGSDFTILETYCLGKRVYTYNGGREDRESN
ncbi:N-acetylglucosamine-6-phosphate deacetylase [Bacillus sp. H-16]|uniref:N-acetylglucosamine-6-phosphate deacetylase n=1 Tax=Alteribacter salitolerans TaxID=2912333 RepID=UPI001962F704|nr:N-acetylglucosamine-6-phosphate deacetylase [Alteribacter salitolerans]MBM7095964.1 N-acetylglucosamine-6-phosphate deacetylase [Alteribacter salitolerans]